MNKVKVTIDRSNDLTSCTANGKITIDDLGRAIKEYLSGEATSKVLWDLREADGSDIDSRDIRNIHEYVKQFPAATLKRKIAVLVARQYGYGMSRVGSTYAKIFEINSDYGIFYSLDEALDWLHTTDDKA